MNEDSARKSTTRRAFGAAVLALLCGGCRRADMDARATNHPLETTMPPRPAPVTWFSLPADHPEAAAAFYRRAFGWKIEPLTREDDPAYDYNVIVDSPSDENYTPAEAGRVNGCIVKRAIGVTTPVVLVEVPDLDQAARDVIEAGGTVVSRRIPMRSLNGEFMLVRDPEGNMLEVFQTTPSAGPSALLRNPA